MSAGVNPTMLKFGYPGTLVREYARWAVLLRPQQATLGALVLACREPATALGGISRDAAGELAGVGADIEAALSSAFAYDKINYLMLMMVDPHVHFHVLPRYSGERRFAGVTFLDTGWPRVPELTRAPELSPDVQAALLDFVRSRWAPS